MVSDTLIIRHLPVSLRSQEVHDFLKYLGAVDVFIHESKMKKYNYAFAKFKNELVAREVLSRIHQKDLLDSRLIVEFADNGYFTSPENEEKKGNIVHEENRKSKMRETFLCNLNSWTVGLNLTLPPPYHLKFRYPAPNSRILFNIANTLSCNVKFYTQVVHLMNKMNLPSPFETPFSLNENDVFDSFVMYIMENVNVEKTKEDTNDSSEEESELESESDRDDSLKHPSNAASIKRKSLPVEKLVKKRRLLKGMIPSSSNRYHKTPIGDVFEQVERDNCPKKIEVKIKTKSNVIHHQLGINVLDEKSEKLKSQVSDLTPLAEKLEERSCQKADEIPRDGCITAEQLASNRIPERDWQMLSFFKNYHPGTPCCRLYLKNLSKHVVAPDLNYIFKRYSSAANSNEQQTTFNIRLMQEGRMKGQAFVTLPTVELAELALKETNGYVMKGKPMVVQFAKAAATKIENANFKE